MTIESKAVCGACEMLDFKDKCYYIQMLTHFLLDPNLRCIGNYN